MNAVEQIVLDRNLAYKERRYADAELLRSTLFKEHDVEVIGPPHDMVWLVDGHDCIGFNEMDMSWLYWRKRDT